jgi:hypothetical protein
MADSTSIGKFPAPYVDQARENDGVVVRVGQDMGEIGSRPSGMPKTMMTERMTIQHVGGGTGASRSNNVDNK